MVIDFTQGASTVTDDGHLALAGKDRNKITFHHKSGPDKCVGTGEYKFKLDGKRALSDACHHHAYELAPTAAELGRRLDAVDRLVKKLESTP